MCAQLKELPNFACVAALIVPPSLRDPALTLICTSLGLIFSAYLPLTSSLMTWILKSFAHFIIGLFVFLELLKYVLDPSLPNAGLVSIFLSVPGLSLHSPAVSFAAHTSFVDCALGVRILCLALGQEDVGRFSSRCSTILCSCFSYLFWASVLYMMWV